MPARGFTLLEVLVVVVIAALLTGLVLLRVGQWRGPDDPSAQLERLAALIEAQCQQAVFQARPRGVRITLEGYDFWQAASQGWQPLPAEGIGRPRAWLGEHPPRLLVEGRASTLADASAPQIVCAPLGELTLFELTLAEARLLGRGDGRLIRPPPSS